jgi:hypothetical protein
MAIAEAERSEVFNIVGREASEDRFHGICDRDAPPNSGLLSIGDLIADQPQHLKMDVER